MTAALASAARVPARVDRTAYRTVMRFIVDEGPVHAGHVAFAALLALFPFLIFLTALAAFLGTPDAANTFIDQSVGLMPMEVAETLRPVVQQVIEGRSGSLLTLSVIGTLWASSSGIEALRAALNRAYGVATLRPLWHRRVQGLLLVTLGSVAILVAMSVMVVVPIAWSHLAPQLGFDRLLPPLFGAGRHVVAFLVLLLVTSMLYRWLPNIPQRWLQVAPGAALAAGAWLLVAWLVSLYLQNFGRFSVIYGSLGGIVVTLLYFFVSAAVVILGAELNAVLRDEREARETAATGKPPE